MDHTRYLDVALEEARLAQSEGSLPAGSVIVAPDGSIVSRGRNRVRTQGDQTAHSELDAIRNAGASVAPNAPTASGSGYILYTSAEPCLMCLGAILVSRIETIVWAASSVTGSAHNAVLSSGYQNERLRAIRIIKEPSPEHRLRSRAMLRESYLKQGNPQLASLLVDA